MPDAQHKPAPSAQGGCFTSLECSSAGKLSSTLQIDVAELARRQYAWLFLRPNSAFSGRAGSRVEQDHVFMSSQCNSESLKQATHARKVPQVLDSTSSRDWSRLNVGVAVRMTES